MNAPPRGPVTTWLHGVLAAALTAADPPALIGDGIAPEEAGWSQGQPGAPDSVFVAYGVLKSLSANPSQRPPVGDVNAAWVIPYTVTSWGAVREQADYVSDLVTTAVAGISKVRGEDSPIPGFGIQLVEVVSLGSVERSDQVDPKLWTRSDPINVRVARARTA